MDHSPPGSSVRGIFPARMLRWVTMLSSKSFPDPGIESTSPVSPALQMDSLPLSHWGNYILNNQFSSVAQSCPTMTPWTAACQASLSITNSQSLLKLMSIKLGMPSTHLILCHPLLLLPSIFPSIRVFSKESFTSGGRSIGASASASVLSMNIQYWFLLGLIGLISLQSNWFSGVFSNTTVAKQ